MSYRLQAAFIAAFFSSTLFASIPSTSGNVISLPYKTLYQRLKFNNDFERTKVGFFLVTNNDKQICQIQRVRMTKNEKMDVLNVSDAQEILVPVDAHLRKVNPTIHIELKHEQRCDPSFQILFKEKALKEINEQEIRHMMKEVDELMASLSGFFGRWSLPKTKGVILHYSRHIESVNHNAVKDLSLTANTLFITPENIKKHEKNIIKNEISKIAPWFHLN